MTRLDLADLTLSWPGAATPALDSLTMTVGGGELLALLGPSGCGKTTALRLVAGLLAPSAGDIRLDGRSVLRDPPERRGVVMMFQNHLLFPHLTVAQNVGFGLRMRGLPAAAIAARVAEMLDRVHLSGMGARMPSALSGGQAQRVALARALVVAPRVLLLDEPLASLDAGLRGGMRDLIRGVQKDLGITTVFVTHDQEEAVAIADRVTLILNGRLRQHGPPEAFYRRPADRDVADFFGACNLIPGVAAGGVFDGPLGPLVLPADARTGPGLLTFRPESVRIGAGPVNTLAGVVRAHRFLGTRTRLTLAAGGATIEADVPPDSAAGLVPGAALTVHLPPAALWVIPPA